MTGGDRPRYLAVIVLAMEPSWLALDRAARSRWADAVDVVCDRHGDVAIEWFDADGLSSQHTTLLNCRFDELEAYQRLWEGLREMELFARPYMRVVDILVGRSQGAQALSGAHASATHIGV